ncbi:MAG: molecular chaperone TorD family protein [Chloroflexi bacterium]|nr:molecular chaperone TorD family protein [Chloroflexota bacterium]
MTGDMLETRLILYRLLAALYHYPMSEETLEALRSLDWQENGGAAEALREAQSALDAPLSAAMLERLNVEMTRLMEGPGVTPAIPYASYHLHGQQLMGPSAQAVRRLYLEWGVAPEQGAIPPDHLSLELGFLSFLAEQTLEDDKREDALRASLVFLREHLLPWLPQFCAALETSAREPFFGALSRLTRQVAAADELWLHESLSGQLIELS